MRKSLSVALVLFGMLSLAHADSTTAAVQQKLKDQGFYYGGITGTADSDTTAAIRRYQIRNGLKITGELNAETQKSLGVHGAAPNHAVAPSPTPERSQKPTSGPTSPPDGDTSDLRDNESAAPPRAPGIPQQPGVQPQNRQPGYAPDAPGVYPAPSGALEGTPFQVAPADVQRRVVAGAQMRLARLGYYRSVVDGEFGAGTVAAVRAYQSRFGIAPSGRLDVATLAALGLLPGQPAPGINVPSRRMYRPPTIAPGPGERLYVPR